MASMPVIVSATTNHTHTVIFLHGRGDVAENFVASLRCSKNSRSQSLEEAFPSFRWVFPKAGVSASFSFGGNKVSQWFDIWDVRDFSEREEVQILGLRESTDMIRKVLNIEAGILGGHWDKIILAGISQGAATATHALLNLKMPEAADDGTKLSGGLAAFLGFSCRMPFPGRTLKETRAVLSLKNGPDPEDNEVIRKTPVLLEHCVDDPLVSVENGRVLGDTLRGFGARVHSREYPDGGHWFNSPAGMDDVVEYLTHVLGLSPSPATGAAAKETEMDLS
ncbi:Phospholipase/Carboxylesterase family protein [Metarhizium album ARSEF 1941]|uniref:Phospholipase/Carboxylesterase family protein n=1 Tax=Metarhizium album (strain ARSEF 1941) TaxID=1081103 RepID=A0A0B2X4G1_METAS|nr:Phospholipase/Carboxylesterase family protein [Metarhizium album ARSEF 1941]KHO00305.1 Phospholipase/Carboxylesterase family protein [Metarhizium album ARSEF 1941]